MTDMLVGVHHDNIIESSWLERLTGMEWNDIKFVSLQWFKCIFPRMAGVVGSNLTLVVYLWFFLWDVKGTHCLGSRELVCET